MKNQWNFWKNVSHLHYPVWAVFFYTWLLLGIYCILAIKWLSACIAQSINKKQGDEISHLVMYIERGGEILCFDMFWNVYFQNIHQKTTLKSTFRILNFDSMPNEITHFGWQYNLEEKYMWATVFWTLTNFDFYENLK
jgi:hypothetical protein